MQLTGHESIATGIIGTPNQSNTQSASYDLSADRVIIDGQTKNLPFSLPPQHMCVIVSKEHVKIPPDFVGYALPKTRLCQRGLLTLNTGILDPTYDGLISTVAINFRREPVEIRPNDAFLRIVIHELKPFTAAGGSVTSIKNLPDEKYIKAREEESAAYPATFLDIPSSLESVSGNIRDRIFSQLGINLTIAVAIIGVVFTIVNVFITYFQTKSAVSDVRDIATAAATNTAAVNAAERSINEQAGRFGGLQARVDELANSTHADGGKIDELERNFTRLDVITKGLENRVQNTERRR
jgi:dUTPase